MGYNSNMLSHQQFEWMILTTLKQYSWSWNVYKTIISEEHVVADSTKQTNKDWRMNSTDQDIANWCVCDKCTCIYFRKGSKKEKYMSFKIRSVALVLVLIFITLNTRTCNIVFPCPKKQWNACILWSKLTICFILCFYGWPDPFINHSCWNIFE